MYPVYSMANHSCAASAMAIVGGSAKGYELQLRAQVPIRKVGGKCKTVHCKLYFSSLLYNEWRLNSTSGRGDCSAVPVSEHRATNQTIAHVRPLVLQVQVTKMSV